MIRCPRCNTELPDGVSFCDACGAPVRGQMPPASPVYQPFAGDSAAASPAGPLTCPVCGSPAIAGEAYCDNCGASLLAPSSAAYPPPFAVPPPPAAPFTPPPAPAAPFTAAATQSVAVPPAYAPAGMPAPAPAPEPAARPARLVVVTSRAELPLPARDDIVLGREDAQSNSFPDLDLNPHGALDQGVSRRHARITHRGGQYFLEDLNSVNGTLLNQRRIPANTPMPMRPGDHIMLGRLGLTFEV